MHCSGSVKIWGGRRAGMHCWHVCTVRPAQVADGSSVERLVAFSSLDTSLRHCTVFVSQQLCMIVNSADHGRPVPFSVKPKRNRKYRYTYMHNDLQSRIHRSTGAAAVSYHLDCIIPLGLLFVLTDASPSTVRSNQDHSGISAFGTSRRSCILKNF